MAASRRETGATRKLNSVFHRFTGRVAGSGGVGQSLMVCPRGMNEPTTRVSYLSDPGWGIGRNPRPFPGGGRSWTRGEIRIEDGKLLLLDYLADDPEEAVAACPAREVAVLPVRRWFGSGVCLDLGVGGRWYLKPPSSRLGTGRGDTRRLTEALAEARRLPTGQGSHAIGAGDAAHDVPGRRRRLVWKYELSDDDGTEIGPVWLDTLEGSSLRPISTEDLGWTTREQARLMAEKRGCEFVDDAGEHA